MSVDYLPGTENVIRFPIELRKFLPIDILYGIIPDVREVESDAEAFGLERPNYDYFDRGDRIVAEHILNHVRPEPGMRRNRELDAILEPMVERALELCRKAKESAEVSRVAVQKARNARYCENSRMSVLDEEAREACLVTTACRIAAYEAAREALGAERAVRIAKSGQAWRPRDRREEEKLVFGL